MKYRKKLIEVALPLEAINAEAAREKSIRHGHPSTLHLWWARRPLAACRAVLFGQLVDDPSSVPEEFPDEAAQDAERERLFAVIEELVKWENSTNARVIGAARREIARSVARWRKDRGEAEDVDEKMLGGEPPAKEVDRFLAEKAPPVYDPFCGGGSIPLEAQRLGLRAIASDLNPVAVLITKALVEIPPKFAGRPPVNPESRRNAELKTWKGAQGLAEDVRYYGKWMRDEAEKRIGHLYPKVTVTAEMAAEREDLKRYVGRELTVIAWLWARTVTCPNPACGATMPLVRSFWLSKKKTRRTWIEPIAEKKGVRFSIAMGDGKPQDGTVERRGARCLCCESPVPFDHVRSEGRAGRMGQQLLAIALEGDRERVYVEPKPEQERIAASAQPENMPETALPEKALGFRVQNYGMTRHQDLFTNRQLVALTTFSSLVIKARNQAENDACSIGQAKGDALAQGGTGGRAYSDAQATFLAFAISRSADFWCTIAVWSPQPKNELVSHAFTRQAIPMTWDFAEANPFSTSGGNFAGNCEFVVKNIRSLTLDTMAEGDTRQADAVRLKPGEYVFSTDPPYYDNIGYADLSDFFYVWLRSSLREIYPSLMGTMLTPKDTELIASDHRDRSNGKSPEVFFEDGLRAAFGKMHSSQLKDLPSTVFYAFKQAESDDSEGAIASTGWETMLSGLNSAGLAPQATWPMRTERSGRTRDIGSNALASSVVLTCRARPANASPGTRNEFVATLQRELPEALKRLQDASIAPVDLAQSAIGPGMAVFSRYAKVLEPDGKEMTVRTALGLINQVLDEVLAAEEADYDADTRWAITWFTQHGFGEAPYGEAETLSKARNTSVTGLVKAGILEARGGKVRLLPRDELADGWDPSVDARFTVWEACQNLIKALETGGESAAAELLRRLGSSAAPARELAYRLYQHCERTKQAEEARAYNGLVVAWPRLTVLASERASEPVELSLDFGS